MAFEQRDFGYSKLACPPFPPRPLALSRMHMKKNKIGKRGRLGQRCCQRAPGLQCEKPALQAPPLPRAVLPPERLFSTIKVLLLLAQLQPAPQACVSSES